MREDPLGWLVPEAASGERAALRRVITALRLLRDDALVRARHAPPSWTRARSELEALEKRRGRSAVDGLLHAYVCAQRGPDSFLDLGARSEEYAAAWRILLGTVSEESFPPGPGEPPRAVVARLLAAGEAQGASRAWRTRWEAAALHVAGAAIDAERRWAALLARARGARARPPHLARLLKGLVAARLERFHPARAWSLFAANTLLAASDAGLRRSFGWSALLTGDLARARQLLQRDDGAWLPAPLAELREDRPEWAALLSGTQEPPATEPLVARHASRRALGALLVGVFARRRDSRLELLALDAPGVVRGEAARRLARGIVGPEDARDGEVLRQRGTPGSEPGCAEVRLGGSRSSALARAALRGPEGELAGWLQIESVHQLLPSSATLRALAQAWRPAVLEAHGESTVVRTRSSPLVEPRPLALDDPRVEFSTRLLGGLGPLRGARAYWIEPGPLGKLWLLAERGLALGGWSEARGGARAIQRALEAREPVAYRSSSEAGMHAAALRGWALPLVSGARVLGCLALESSLASSGGLPLVVARARLEALRAVWWSTAFRAHSRDGEEGEIVWDLERRFPASLESALPALIESRAPLLIVGPPGSGRRTLARWIDFRARRDGRGIEGAVRLRVLEVDDLEPEAQLRLCATSRTAPRLFLLATAPVHVLRERGRLMRELERHLDPLPVCVPPLRSRRDEIPGLARVRAAEVARGGGHALARLEDDAIGALWRQDWPGNVAQLGALVTQLVRARPGGRIGAGCVHDALRSRGLRARERLSSLRPRALDLEFALETTRHHNGNENWARAARYLGWDPDTLSARLGPPHGGGG